MHRRLITLAVLVMLLPITVIHAHAPPQFASLEVITPDNVRFIQDLWTLPINGGSVNDVVWSPDDSLLAVAADHDILLFDANDWGKPPRVLSGHQSLIWDLSFSPDGKSLASSSGGIGFDAYGNFYAAKDNTARIWDVEKGYARVVITHLADEQIVRNVSFYDNGTQIVTVNLDHNILRYWDSQTGKFLQAYSIDPPDHWPWILGNGFSEDGSLYGLGTIHNEFRLWRLTPSPEVVKLPSFLQYGAALTFSNDNHHMAAANRYGTEGVIFSFADSRIYRTNSPLEQFKAQTFDPTAKLLVQSTYQEINADPRIRIWDVDQAEQIVVINPPGNADIEKFAFSHNGRMLVIFTSLWDFERKVYQNELHLWGIPTQ